MSADELRQEIEQTRQSLGETVDELAAKADVKARARAKAAEAKARTRDRVADVSGRVRRSQAVQRHWPAAAMAAGVLLAGAGAVMAWQEKREA
jgi:Protein of unknown function (DUF3618)